MLVPMSWLKDYTDIPSDMDEFSDKMIMSGSNIETIEVFGENFHRVVVGKVLSVDKHPDADRLTVCKVDVGEDAPVQIVCGAPNVVADALVPVALHKSRIPGPLHGQPKEEGGVQVKKGKLRGVESMGMICSAGELGFDDKVVPVSHRDGIWILPDNSVPGTAFENAMELAEQVVEFEITPNRSDCLSMVGMAREAAATFDVPLRYPVTDLLEEGEGISADHISVEIKNPEACRRYVARVVTDVKIEQSPWWLQRRLMYAGMRPINNIVDITNFVMLEQGNPIHAFDIRQIEGGKIVVEKGSEGEKFVTLDEKERTLTEDMLLIKDGKKGVAIAGVMGGLNSEIREDTQTILIESANFEPTNIRETSKKLGLRTEASARYEKGVDPNLCRTAADRVCKLIEELGAGKVLKGAVDAYPEPVIPWTIELRVSRVKQVLGVEFTPEEIKKIFDKLEMKTEEEGEILRVTPPTVRPDLRKEIDLVEEIARMYGYDNFPSTLPRDNSESRPGRMESIRRKAREVLCAMGASEIQTYSFVSPGDVDRVRIDEDAWERNFVRLINPLGEENSVMRTILTPGMLETMGRNYSRNVEEVKAYEIGNTFFKNLIEEGELPDEQDSISIGLYGGDNDFFTLKGMVIELLKNLGITHVEFKREENYGVYHPGRCARIVLVGENMNEDIREEFLRQADRKVEGSEEEIHLMKEMVTFMAKNREGGEIELGIMGEVHPDVAKEYGIDTKCYCCELMFHIVGDYARTDVRYTPLPRYPSTGRDIALLLDEEIPAGRVEALIRQNGGEILEEVRLFDIYRGEQVDKGKKSLAFTLTYRSREKTLTEEEVAPVHERVLEALKEELNAVLREV